jgi:hypothetical protein
MVQNACWVMMQWACLRSVVSVQEATSGLDGKVLVGVWASAAASLVVDDDVFFIGTCIDGKIPVLPE